MKQLLFLLLLLAASGGSPGLSGASAQSPARGGATGALFGTVQDGDSGTSLVGATVAVWRDSSLVSGAITDLDGAFRVPGLASGAYRVEVSFIGFTAVTLDPVTVASGEQDLGAVVLAPDAGLLDAVAVTAERAAIEVDIDRMVYNVGNDLNALGGSVSDLLENIPSVEVDVEGNVSLRGVSNVAVLINGRPAPVGSDFIAAYLQSLPAGAIERIEVMPNPSAKYEPDGIGGILNVVLKENTELGIGGAVTAGADTQGGANGTVLLTYGQGPLDLTATVGLRQSVRETEGTRFRENRYEDPLTTLDQTFLDASDRSSANVTLNADYALSPTTTLNAGTQFGYRASGGDEATTFLALDALGATISDYERVAAESDDGLNGGLSLGVRWDAQGGRTQGVQASGESGGRGGPGGPGGGRGESSTSSSSLGAHTFVAGVSLRASDNTGTDLFTDQDALGVLAREQTDQDRSTLTAAVNVDYSRPLGSVLRLETGYKGEIESRDDARSFFEEEDGAFVLDPLQSNAFVYDQTTHSAYAQLRAQLGALGLQGGLRAESAQTTFTPEASETFSNDYASLFPSAFATYQLTDATVLRASYSRRINRPNGRFLDPLASIDDPLNISQGNPELQPEYTDAYEASVMQLLPFGSVSVTPYWRRTTDVIRRVQLLQPDGVTLSTFENLDTSTSGGVEGVVSFTGSGPLAGIGGSLSLEGYRIVTDGTSVDSDLEADASGWGSRLSLKYGVTPSTDVQLSASYRAPMETEQGSISARQYVDLSLRQKLSPSASLALRVSDPFGTAGFNSILDQQSLYQEYDRNFGRQQVGLTFSYAFGGADQRDVQRASGADTSGDLGDGDL